LTAKQPNVAFNHFAQRSIRESDDAWRALREQQCPVAWTEANGGHWVVSRYAEVAEAFKDWETFSSARTDPRYSSISLGNVRIAPLFPEELDPPEWYPLRQILSEMLSPNAVRRLQSRIEHWVTHYVDQVIEKGACEFASDVVCPVPAAVILELLGFPSDDWARVSWAFHAGAAYEHGSPEAASVGTDLAWVSARVTEELAERRREPRADGLTYIAQSLVDGETISISDSEALVLLVIGGGVDTTTSVTSAALVHLARNPDHRRRLIEHPELLEHATEEFLRMYPPARTHARTVTRDVEFAGCQLARGDRVLISEVSACHDDRAFPDADAFVIDRFPNRHVAFGLGIHRCPGSHLARAQFKEIVRQVLTRMPDYSVDLDHVVEYPNWSVIGGWSKIPATFPPGPRVSR
jgi:cytochrome P450